MSEPGRVQQRRAANPFAPRIALRWLSEPDPPRHRRVDGSLLYADISGFTRLTERLAARGRAGAEEVVALTGAVMTRLVAELEAWGGDVVVFAGDALVVLFEGGDSPARAARAAGEIRGWFAANGAVTTSVGQVSLRVSIGIATGPVDLVLAGDEDRALFLVGPTTTRVAQLEHEAAAGDVMLDARTAAALDPDALREGRAGGFLMRRVLRAARRVGPSPVPEDVDPAPFITPPLRPFLDPESGATVESEHRQAAIGFVVAGGLDQRLESGDGAAAAADLDAWFRAACQAGERHHIAVLDTDITADGAVLFLAAGAPVATGDEEEHLLRAMRDILAIPEAARLRLRAGVSRGPVFAGEFGARGRRTYTAMGDTTNLAARIAHRAAPGQLLATADVLARTRTEFASLSLEAFSAKGKREPILAYAVGAPGSLRSRAADRLPLAGRGEELGTLRQLLGEAAAGRGGLAEIIGEAGSGKSRLLAELMASPGASASLVVRCSTFTMATPYGAWRPVLRRLADLPDDADPAAAGERLAAWVSEVAPDAAPWLPLLAIPFGASVAPTAAADAIDPAFRRARLHAVLADLLAEVSPPGSIIAVEDLHWADEASIALTSALATSRAGRRWLIIVLRRPSDDPDERLAVTPKATIELGALDPDAVARLALAAAGTALSDADLRAIVERADGNPLFARELAEAAAAQGSTDRLPDKVESLIASRIDRLGTRQRRILRRAAVLGRVVAVDLLAEVLAGDDDVRNLTIWDDLHEFVGREGPSTLRFRHDLVRDVAYEGLSHTLRRSLHLALARATERRAGSDTDAVAAELATHFARGGDPAPAFRYAIRAGDLARAQSANVDAAAMYRRALAAAAELRSLTPDVLLPVCESLGDVAELAGRYDEAKVAYDRGRRLAAAWEADLGEAGVASPDQPRLHLARLAHKRGMVMERMGRYAEAVRWAGRSRRILESIGEAGSRDAGWLDTRLQLAVGALRQRQGRYSLAVGAALPAYESAKAGGYRDLEAHAAFLLHAAYGDLGSPEVVRFRDVALPIYEELGDLAGQGNVLNNLGIEAYFEGRWEDALQFYRRSYLAKARVGDVANAAIQQNNEAEILSDQGRTDEAEVLLREALRVWTAAGFAIGVALATSNMGRAAARSGRPDEGLAGLEQAAANFERIGADGYVDETRARVAECLVLAGRPAGARTVATETLERVRRETGQSVLGAQLERVLAWAALLEGDAADAEAHAATSLAEGRALSAAFEVALTLDAATMIPGRSAGDVERDRAEAERILGGLGVVRVARPELGAPVGVRG